MTFLRKYWPLLILLAASWYPFFYMMDARPVILWDESRNAVNAIEMAENGHVLVRYFDGEWDSWEVKPPVLTWFQALGLKVFGYDVIGLRMPVALFALMTVIMLFLFGRRSLESPLGGMITGLILMTSAGYVGIHVARSGDHDTLHAFFLTLSALFIWLATRQPEPPKKYLWGFTAALILAVLTKSIAGFFFLPGILLYLVISKNFRRIVLRPHTLLYIGVFLLCVGGYYGLREIQNPGYLKQVWTWELLPKFTNSSGNHDHAQESFFYYFQNILKERFVPWIFLLPLSVFAIRVWGNEKQWEFVKFAGCVLLPFFLVISSGTAAFWYDAPLYPLMALVTGLGMGIMLDAGLEKLAGLKKTAGMILILFALFAFPYRSLIAHIWRQSETPANELYGTALKKICGDLPKGTRLYIMSRGYNASVTFYKLQQRFTDGLELIQVDQPVFAGKKLKMGSHCLSCEEYPWEEAPETFAFDTLGNFQSCYLLKVKSIQP